MGKKTFYKKCAKIFLDSQTVASYTEGWYALYESSVFPHCPCKSRRSILSQLFLCSSVRLYLTFMTYSCSKTLFISLINCGWWSSLISFDCSHRMRVALCIPGVIVYVWCGAVKCVTLHWNLSFSEIRKEKFQVVNAISMTVGMFYIQCSSSFCFPFTFWNNTRSHYLTVWGSVWISLVPK